MKTIAVLTDFSKHAEHAAKYALQLAQIIKADVLLFNAFLVPADIPQVASHVAWPIYEYDEIKRDAEKEADKFCKKLKKGLTANRLTNKYWPTITWQCEEGPLVNTLSKLEENKEIILIILGTHSTDGLTTFVLGNNCREVIDTTKLPLLLVPENVSLKSFKKITFTTDLTYNDVKYIKALSGLADHFLAEILIVNVSPDASLNAEHDSKVSLFMADVKKSIGYNKIKYRDVDNESAKSGLLWLLENDKPDMMVMIHRKGNFWDFLFKSSVTKKIAAHISVPLLVYPYPIAAIPEL